MNPTNGSPTPPDQGKKPLSYVVRAEEYEWLVAEHQLRQLELNALKRSIEHARQHGVISADQAEELTLRGVPGLSEGEVDDILRWRRTPLDQRQTVSADAVSALMNRLDAAAATGQATQADIATIIEQAQAKWDAHDQ